MLPMRNVFDAIHFNNNVCQNSLSTESVSEARIWTDHLPEKSNCNNILPSKKRAASDLYEGLQKKLKTCKYPFQKLKNTTSNISESSSIHQEKTSESISNLSSSPLFTQCCSNDDIYSSNKDTILTSNNLHTLISSKNITNSTNNTPTKETNCTPTTNNAPVMPASSIDLVVDSDHFVNQNMNNMSDNLCLNGDINIAEDDNSFLIDISDNEDSEADAAIKYIISDLIDGDMFNKELDMSSSLMDSGGNETECCNGLIGQDVLCKDLEKDRACDSHCNNIECEYVNSKVVNTLENYIESKIQDNSNSTQNNHIQGKSCDQLNNVKSKDLFVKNNINHHFSSNLDVHTNGETIPELPLVHKELKLNCDSSKMNNLNIDKIEENNFGVKPEKDNTYNNSYLVPTDLKCNTLSLHKDGVLINNMHNVDENINSNSDNSLESLHINGVNTNIVQKSTFNTLRTKQLLKSNLKNKRLLNNVLKKDKNQTNSKELCLYNEIPPTSIFNWDSNDSNAMIHPNDDLLCKSINSEETSDTFKYMYDHINNIKCPDIDDSSQKTTTVNDFPLHKDELKPKESKLNDIFCEINFETVTDEEICKQRNVSVNDTNQFNSDLNSQKTNADNYNLLTEKVNQAEINEDDINSAYILPRPFYFENAKLNEEGLLVFESSSLSSKASTMSEDDSTDSLNLDLADENVFIYKRVNNNYICNTQYFSSIPPTLLSDADVKLCNKHASLNRIYKKFINNKILNCYTGVNSSQKDMVQIKKEIESEDELSSKRSDFNKYPKNIVNKLKKCLNVNWRNDQEVKGNNENHSLLKKVNMLPGVCTFKDLGLVEPKLEFNIDDCPSLKAFLKTSVGANQTSLSSSELLSSEERKLKNSIIFDSSFEMITSVKKEDYKNDGLENNLVEKKRPKYLQQLKSSAGYIAENKFGNSVASNLFDEEHLLTREERQIKMAMARITKEEVIQELKKIKKDEFLPKRRTLDIATEKQSKCVQTKKSSNKKSVILNKIFKGKPSSLHENDDNAENSINNLDTNKNQDLNYKNYKKMNHNQQFAKKILLKMQNKKKKLSSQVKNGSPFRKKLITNNLLKSRYISTSDQNSSLKKITLSPVQMHYVKRCLTRRGKNCIKLTFKKHFAKSKSLFPNTYKNPNLPYNMSEIPNEVRKVLMTCHHSSGETVLHKAARLNLVDVAEWVCASRLISVEQVDNAGFTPLIEACNNKSVDVVRCLLAYGANPNAPASHQQNGIRPLHEAIFSDNLKIVHLLLCAGADISLPTYSLKTPIYFAQSDSMRTYLLDCKADFYSKDTAICKPWQVPFNDEILLGVPDDFHISDSITFKFLENT